MAIQRKAASKLVRTMSPSCADDNFTNTCITTGRECLYLRRDFMVRFTLVSRMLQLGVCDWYVDRARIELPQQLTVNSAESDHTSECVAVISDRQPRLAESSHDGKCVER